MSDTIIAAIIGGTIAGTATIIAAIIKGVFDLFKDHRNRTSKDEALKSKKPDIRKWVGIIVILTLVGAAIGYAVGHYVNSPLPASPTPTLQIIPSNPVNGGIKICRMGFVCNLTNTGHNDDQKCEDFIEVTKPFPVRRILIEMSEKGNGFGYSLWEVTLFNDTSQVSLKGIATATASSSEGLSFIGCEKANCAVDGDIATRWGSDWAHDSNPNQWLDITLKSSVKFNHLNLEWEKAFGKSYCITMQ